MEAGDLPDSAEKRFVYTISIINGKARQMRQQKFMNDFDAAKTAFEAYLDEYDREDDKIHLKIVHTYGVVEDAEAISRRMGLNEEDVQLAKVIGLLHDIGRFEQIKRFDSFEPGTMEHAAYGAQLLFGPEKMIRRFVKDDRFDELICTAIEKHSDFKLEGITDERTLLHAKLIRDADKLDNCRVKLEEAMETLLGVDEKGAGDYCGVRYFAGTNYGYGICLGSFILLIKTIRVGNTSFSCTEI